MLSELEIFCLNEIADDYEEIPQIRVQLRDTAKCGASLEEIATSLVALVASGLAKCYAFDKSKQEYVMVPYAAEIAGQSIATAMWRPGENIDSRLWFYITKEGKEMLNGLPDGFRPQR